MAWLLLTLAHALPVQVSLAALTLAALMALIALRPAHDRRTSPVVRRTQSLRHRAAKLAFLRLRDPDSAGRPRPRAPSTA